MACTPSSLVFVDLETTGLPAFQSKTRITELCFWSVDRSHFLQCKPNDIDSLPRVMNRLNLCLYPSRSIDPVVTGKTLLDNWNLENQSPFTEDVYNMISGFLRRLHKPVCLIAHKGKSFDFPILKSEIERLGKTLPEDLMCVDTIPIFQKLDSALSTPTMSEESSLDGDGSSLEINPFQIANETTPERLLTQKPAGEAVFNTDRSKKMLFSPNQLIRYDIGSVYERVFGKKLASSRSHDAEGDVEILFKLARTRAKEFVQIVDVDAVPFNQIVKCW